MLIDILIPTYKRRSPLEKNLEMLTRQIEKYALSEYFTISISDNCSNDGTVEMVEVYKKKSPVPINLYRHSSEIFIEKNQIYPLEVSLGDYVIYLGDDDYLPDGYLKYLVDLVLDDKSICCVIPGFSGLYADGSVRAVRNAKFRFKRYDPSFLSVFVNSGFGHQISGLLFRKDSIYNDYVRDEGTRNMYPWVYFIGVSCLRGRVIYSPQHQVFVSQSNEKHWRYDDSGLIIEVLKNYKKMYPDNQLRRLALSVGFAAQQSWRLRVGKSPANAIAAFLHIIKSKDVDMLFKLSLLGLYPYCYAKKIVALLTKKIFIRAVN